MKGIALANLSWEPPTEPPTVEQLNPARRKISLRERITHVVAGATTATAMLFFLMIFTGHLPGDLPDPSITTTVTSMVTSTTTIDSSPEPGTRSSIPTTEPSEIDSGPSTPAEGIETPAPADVYRQGRLALVAERQQADLDAPPSDAQWGILQSQPDGENDIEFRPYGGPSLGNSGSSSRFVELTGSEKADFETCRTAQGYSNHTLPLKNIKEGSRLCLFTSERRFAALSVTSIAQDLSRIELIVHVYKKEGD